MCDRPVASPPLAEPAASWLPILTFHSLDDEGSVLSYPPRLFEQGLAMLAARGFGTMPLHEVAARVREGAPLPARTVVLTFDDGYRSVYERAFPALRRHGMSATVFLTVGGGGAASGRGRLPPYGGRPMLDWGEIREMAHWGIEFGAHTLTHPDLRGLPAERVQEEIVGSKAIVEDALGRPARCFAYPFGRHDRRSRRVARRHFDCACSDDLGVLTAKSDLHALPRVEMYYFRGRRTLGLLTGGLLPWYLRARDVPRRPRRALR